MIDSIELTNWKTHRHTVMNFQSGVNVLIGVMGAGKSSVMDAISFALFGTFPALSHRRTTIENIISSRPAREDSSEVRLRFGADGDTYTIARSVSRSGATTARLEKNGSYLQAQPERVNEEIERLLKVDYDTFSRVIYSEQNRLAYFLELAKGERKKQIDHMLGLDSFAKAEENSISLINSIRGLILDEEKTLAGIDANELKKQLAKLATEKQALMEERETLGAGARKASAGIAELNRKLATLKERYDAKRRLTNEISALQSRAATLKEELGKLVVHESDEKLVNRRLDEGEKRAGSMDASLRKLRSEHEALARAIGSIESRLATEKKSKAEKDMLVSKLKKTPEALKEESARIDASLCELVDKNAALRASRDELLSWISELAKHITKCPVCERELSAELKDTLLGEKKAALKEIETSLVKNDKELAEMRRREKDAIDSYNAARLATEKIDEHKDVEAALGTLARQEEQAKAKLDELASGIDEASSEKEKLSKELLSLGKELEAIVKKTNYETNITQSLAMIEMKNSELGAVDVDDKEMDVVQESLRKESASLGDMNAKLESCARIMSGIDAQLVDKAKQASSAEAMQERIGQRRAQTRNLTKFKDALIETEALLRNQLVSSINSMMQNVWRELYPYADYTAIRLNATGDDYALEVLAGADGSSAWADVDAMASGGERSIACLAMRIAMAMVTVPNLRWLILDEPTHNIDEKGISNIIEIFGSTLPRVVEQIFIITHDSNLKNIASAKVYQLEKDKEKNEPTTVSEL
jgi:exonuclease SbcC